MDVTTYQIMIYLSILFYAESMQNSVYFFIQKGVGRVY